MAYTAANFRHVAGEPPGRGMYRYDTTDDWVTVEAAGYFNNADDDLNLALGDSILICHWNTAVFTGTIADMGWHVVTNVIANDAAASAGAVNVSGDMWKTGQVSSKA